MEQSRDRREFWIQVRMGLVISVFAAMLLAVCFRVYYLQTVQGEDLVGKAADQIDRQITLRAKRGSILDRNGVELAVSVEAPSIAVRPRVLTDPADTARRLAPLLDNWTEEELLARIEKKGSFVWLARQTHPEVGEAVAKLRIRGVEVHVESKRFYPLQDRAGQLLGFTNIDGVGLEGLERAFDRELTGGEFSIRGVRDARGRTLLTEAMPEFKQFEGHSVVMTIDERVQRVAEQSLREQVEKYEAKGGYAIAIDVHTGDVLALANTPAFDPNHFGDHEPADWRLRAVTDTFEPGSTFKPLVLAAALAEGTVRLSSAFDCEQGRIRIGRYTIRDSHPEGMLTAAEIIKESSNIGAYKIAQTMGKETFYRYIRAFGFGSVSGLGMRGEQPGLVWPPDRWAEVSFANIAFGQGLTATPLQVTNFAATIANGGLLMKPRLVKEVLDKDGKTVREYKPTLVRRVVSPDVARQVAWSMSLVTTAGGTGTNAAMEHYTVAGKTGTAQKVNPETRRYDPHMWVGSFVGFVPAEKPEVAILVMIDEPQKSHYGGVVAAPAFKRIAQEVLKNRAVVPLAEDERFELDDEDEAPDKAVAAAEPADNVVELPVVRVPPTLQEVDGGVPDFRGMSLRQSIEQARRLGVLPLVEGWGRVVSQEPAPGTPIEEETTISLVLSPATRRALLAEEPSAGPGQTP